MLLCSPLYHSCFVITDISHHTVLDPVSNMDGVLKPVPSINPDNMPPPTSCWHQMRKNLTHILCSKYVAWAIVIAIIAVLCGYLATHCKYKIYYLFLVQIIVSAKYFNVCSQC